MTWTFPHIKKVRRTFWRYADADYEALCEDLTQLPPSVLQSDDVNSVWSQWRDYFLYTVSKHIPHKLSASKKTLPWFSPLLKFLSRKRDKLFHLAKTSNSPSAWLSFRKARNKAVTALRSAKKQFLQNLSSSACNPRQFWSAYYSLRPNRQCIPVHLTNGSVTVESACNKCDLLNSHFVSVFSDPDCYSPVPSSAPDAPGLTSICCSSEDIHRLLTAPGLTSICCSSEDIHRLLTSLPQKTDSGPDGISSQMLKHTACAIAPQLSTLFNLSLSSGIVPTDWKLSNVTPVYKAGDPKLVSKYRPISLLSLPSKLLERFVHNKLLHNLLSNSLLFHTQFGFRPSSSTQEAIISATTDWHTMLDSKANVAAVFFDLSKAFPMLVY